MMTASLPNVSEQKSGRLLKALVEIGQELASTTDIEELLDSLLRVARDVFRFENAIIRLLDDDGLLYGGRSGSSVGGVLQWQTKVDCNNL